MQVVDSNIEESSQLLKILSELFCVDDLDRKKLVEEYKIILLNNKCKLKHFLTKHQYNEKITDIDTHCYKFNTYDQKQKEFIKSITDVDTENYISSYIVLTENNTYFCFLFIAKKDINALETENKISKISSSLSKLQNNFETETPNIVNKIKSLDDKLDDETDTLNKKQEKMLKLLTSIQDDLNDVMHKVFPNGRDKILL